MNPNKFNNLTKFTQQNMKNFDASHNFDHVKRVYENTLKIIDSVQFEKYEIDTEIITYASILHDIRDHKYPESISEAELREFLETELSEKNKVDYILEIIDNISYSKQISNNNEYCGNFKIYIDIIRDADRLEAIGSSGLERCFHYHRYKLKQNEEDVLKNIIKHCYEKLLRLYPEYFIVTTKGRELALPLHLEIVDFVSKYKNQVFMK